MFSKDTKKRLISALTRKSLANEFEALSASPGPASKQLKASILAAMADKKSANNLIASLETAGLQIESAKTKARCIQMMTRKAAGNEILTAI